MKTQISRQTLLAAGPMAFAACETANGVYFGKTDPPSSQRLVYLIGSEGDTLDPGKTTGGYERYIVAALFEGLTNNHPSTAQPIAALATHYEVNSNFTQYTFYLRGHPKSKGLELTNTDTLRFEYRSGILSEDFSRGHSAPPDTVPARRSDGTVITAYDFVYSWRRVVVPAPATPQYGYYLLGVQNAAPYVRGLGTNLLDVHPFKYVWIDTNRRPS